MQHLYLPHADHDVRALTVADLAIVPRGATKELMRACPAVAEAVVVGNLVEASIFRAWLLNVGRRDARTRLAYLLCESALRMGAQCLSGPDGYQLPMSQEQLGDVLGLTAVHVNRTIKSLERNGLLHRQRRTIAFPDIVQLREAGDFNALYLHLDRGLI